MIPRPSSFYGSRFQIAEKQKYAVWKAADIRAALRDGRKPMAGPPGGDATMDQDDPLVSLFLGWGPGLTALFWVLYYGILVLGGIVSLTFWNRDKSEPVARLMVAGSMSEVKDQDSFTFVSVRSTNESEGRVVCRVYQITPKAISPNGRRLRGWIQTQMVSGISPVRSMTFLGRPLFP